MLYPRNPALKFSGETAQNETYIRPIKDSEEYAFVSVGRRLVLWHRPCASFFHCRYFSSVAENATGSFLMPNLLRCPVETPTKVDSSSSLMGFLTFTFLFTVAMASLRR